MYFPGLRQALSTICRIGYAISFICILCHVGAAYGQDGEASDSSRSQEHYRLGMRHAQRGDYEKRGEGVQASNRIRCQ